MTLTRGFIGRQQRMAQQLSDRKGQGIRWKETSVTLPPSFCPFLPQPFSLVSSTRILSSLPAEGIIHHWGAIASHLPASCPCLSLSSQELSLPTWPSNVEIPQAVSYNPLTSLKANLIHAHRNFINHHNLYLGVPYFIF